MSRQRKFKKLIHGAQVEAIAQAQAEADFTLAEIGNTYAGPRDRFIVSLVVGYQDDAPYLPKTAKQAASAALALTTDDGSSDTHWYVFDRKTGELTMFEQGDLDDMPINNSEDEEDDDL